MKKFNLFALVAFTIITIQSVAQTTTAVDLSGKTVEFDWAPDESSQDSSWEAKKTAYAPLIRQAYKAQGGKAAYGNSEELTFSDEDKILEIVKIVNFPSPNAGTSNTQYLVKYLDDQGNTKYGFALEAPNVVKTVAQGGEVSIAATWKKGD